MINYENKVIVITGGSSGMGKAFAKELLQKKAKVVIISRNKVHLQNAVNELKIISEDVIGVPCDVSDYVSVKKTVNGIIKMFGRIDGLINAAGVGVYKPIQDISVDEFHSIMDVNYFGTVHMIKASLPFMMKEKSGIIMNISSVAGKGAFPFISAYSGSKFAISGFTEGLYYDLKDSGIKVLLVCPGAVNTNFFANPGFENFPHEERHKNMIEPEEVVRVSLKQLDKGRFETFVPRSWRLKYIARVIIPRIFMWRVNKLLR